MSHSCVYTCTHKYTHIESHNSYMRGLVFQTLHLPRLTPTHSNSTTTPPLFTPNLLPGIEFRAKLTQKWFFWHSFDFIFDRKNGLTQRFLGENIFFSYRDFFTTNLPRLGPNLIPGLQFQTNNTKSGYFVLYWTSRLIKNDLKKICIDFDTKKNLGIKFGPSRGKQIAIWKKNIFVSKS